MARKSEQGRAYDERGNVRPADSRFLAKPARTEKPADEPDKGKSK